MSEIGLFYTSNILVIGVGLKPKFFQSFVIEQSPSLSLKNVTKPSSRLIFENFFQPSLSQAFSLIFIEIFIAFLRQIFYSFLQTKALRAIV